MKEKYNVDIPVDKEHILAHSEIDPVGKPFCPGEKFPFNTIINELRKDIISSINGGICNHKGDCNCKEDYIRYMDKYKIDVVFKQKF